MTQLIGRILRQPQAEKTGTASLDESYVVTHHANTADVVAAIKTGLEEDGLGDLVKEIRTGPTGGPDGRGSRTVKRRPAFAKTEIYLPRVLRVEGAELRDLDYEQDILFELNWDSTDPAPLVASIPENAQAAEGQMQRITLTDTGPQRIAAQHIGASPEALGFNAPYAVRMVSDIVPNPWIARDIVGRLLDGLRRRNFATEKVGALTGLIVEELRRWLDQQREAMAEKLFRSEVSAGRIQFRLRTDKHNWQMPREALTSESEGADMLLSRTGGPLERSLFSPIYKGDFSSQDERDIAVYLDGEHALRWWHRNVARSQYSVQGWRREKIYPDFVFALRSDEEGEKLVVLEMKGEHLSGNDKTVYIQKLLCLMTESYAVERVGGLELVDSAGTTVEADLVLMTEWKTRLANDLGARSV